MKTETPISRAKALASVLPIVAIVLIGLYSHEQYGNDGIVGVLVGLYLISYMVIAVSKWKPERLSPLRRFIYKFQVPFIIAGVLLIIGGTLDMFGML